MQTLCGITQKVSNYYTDKCQFLVFILEKFTPDRKKFTRAPPVVPVTNIIKMAWELSGIDIIAHKKYKITDVGNLKSKSLGKVAKRGPFSRLCLLRPPRLPPSQGQMGRFFQIRVWSGSGIGKNFGFGFGYGYRHRIFDQSGIIG